MIDTKELRRLAESMFQYQVPAVHVEYHAKCGPATVLQLLDERAKLIEVLKLNRSMLTGAREYYSGRALACFDAVAACSDIGIGEI